MNTHSKIFPGLLCPIVLLSAVVLGTAEATAPIVLVEGDYALRAIVDLDGCRASLERPKKELHYLHFRNDCQQPLEEKLALLKAMVETLVSDSEDRSTIRSLFVGRLVLTFPEFSQRLAKAASESPDWDPKRPWKEPGYSNRFVLHLMKQDNLFPELQTALDGFGYEVQVASVEKILMAKPKDIAFGDQLLEQGADPQIKLPFDAMMWFSFSPASSP
jgi:hypothetical protein